MFLLPVVRRRFEHRSVPSVHRDSNLLLFTFEGLDNRLLVNKYRQIQRESYLTTYFLSMEFEVMKISKRGWGQKVEARRKDPRHRVVEMFPSS